MRYSQRSSALALLAVSVLVAMGTWLPHRKRTALFVVDEYGDSAGNLLPVPALTAELGSRSEAQDSSHSQAMTRGMLPVPWAADESSPDGNAETRKLYSQYSYGDSSGYLLPGGSRKTKRFWGVEDLHAVTQNVQRAPRQSDKKLEADSRKISKKFPNFFNARTKRTARGESETIKLHRSAVTSKMTEVARKHIIKKDTNKLARSQNDSEKDWDFERARLEEEAQAADDAAASDDADAVFWATGKWRTRP